MAKAEIVSSTGRPGLEQRTFGRYYFNQSRSIDVDYIQRLCQIGHRAIEKKRMGNARAVGRFILQERQVLALLEKNFPIEAIVPTEGELDGQRLYMVLGAINHPDRRLIHPNYQEIQNEIRSNPKPPSPISPRIQELRQKGFHFRSDLPEIYHDQVFHLWQETFGWDRESIQALSYRLEQEKQLHPKDKTVWIALLISPQNQIVAIAMAERLTIIIRGKTMTIIESTEWKRSDMFEGLRGFMVAILGNLNAQILEDLDGLPIPPLVIAETNVMSRSDRAGQGAGLKLAERSLFDYHIPQFLVQNVAVGDGFEPKGLRDFFMMYLPPEHRELLYNRDERKKILGLS